MLQSSLTWLSSCVYRITVLSNGVLQIYNVQLGDAGLYRCVATNIGSRLKSKEGKLTVNQGTGTASDKTIELVIKSP